MLDSTIPAENTHGKHVLTVKFDRSDVIRYIRDVQGTSHGYLNLTMTGRFIDGTPFLSVGTIGVRMPGDTNFDGRVDMKDVASTAKMYGENDYDTNEDNKIDMTDIAVYAKGRSRSLTTVAQKFGTTTNLASYDMNEDETINMKDIGIVAHNFGKTSTA
jgi:hypothetical protein